jgi:putative acetyltransferase
VLEIPLLGGVAAPTLGADGVVVLIGGVSHAGKTLMAQKLLEKYKMPYLSIDHLKMGLYRADTNCGFTPLNNTEHIADKLWPILKGIIKTVLENKQNLIIEGIYLLPQNIKELEPKYLEKIISFYLGFSVPYVTKHFQSKILGNRCIIEKRGHEDLCALTDYIALNTKLKESCAKYGGKLFEIDGDYNEEMSRVYSWVDEQLQGGDGLRSLN